MNKMYQKIEEQLLRAIDKQFNLERRSLAVKTYLEFRQALSLPLLSSKYGNSTIEETDKTIIDNN